MLLRELIALRQQSVVEFAREAGVSPFSVYRAIQGGGAPTKALGKIAAALGLKPSELLLENGGISMTQGSRKEKVKGNSREEFKTAFNSACEAAEAKGEVWKSFTCWELPNGGYDGTINFIPKAEVTA